MSRRFNSYEVQNSSDLINSLYNLFASKQYGDIIYHSEVERILGFGRELAKYGIYVKKAKDKLIEKSKIFKSIPRSWLAMFKTNASF